MSVFRLLRGLLAPIGLLSCFVSFIGEHKAAVLGDTVVVGKDVHPISRDMRYSYALVLRYIEIRDFAEHKKFSSPTYDYTFQKAIPHRKRDYHYCGLVLARAEIDHTHGFSRSGSFGWPTITREELHLWTTLSAGVMP